MSEYHKLVGEEAVYGCCCRRGSNKRDGRARVVVPQVLIHAVSRLETRLTNKREDEQLLLCVCWWWRRREERKRELDSRSSRRSVLHPSMKRSARAFGLQSPEQRMGGRRALLVLLRRPCRRPFARAVRFLLFSPLIYVLLFHSVLLVSPEDQSCAYRSHSPEATRTFPLSPSPSAAASAEGSRWTTILSATLCELDSQIAARVAFTRSHQQQPVVNEKSFQNPESVTDSCTRFGHCIAPSLLPSVL